MFKLKFVAVCMFAVLVSTAWGQSLMPKTEVTVGYTYGSLDQDVGFGSTGRLNANGWNTGATVFLSRWLGVEGNVTGLTHSEDMLVSNGFTTVVGSASEKHYAFLFGPRISIGHGPLSPFVHGLVGLDRESLSVSGTAAGITFSESASDTAFATALGGGVDFGLTRRLGLVTGADYLLTRHGVPNTIASLLGTSGGATQNNFRVSAGLSIRLGSGFGGGRRR